MTARLVLPLVGYFAVAAPFAVPRLLDAMNSGGGV